MEHTDGENRVFFTYRMPFGKITVASDGSSIVRVALGQARFEGRMESTALTNDCANQLVEYLAGKRTVFDVPISYDGTDFQNKVWDAICEIPYSYTRTSKELAESIGLPGSYRMVGAAVRQNPLVVLVPAHRVVPAGGRIDKGDEHARLRAAFRDLERKHA